MTSTVSFKPHQSHNGQYNEWLSTSKAKLVDMSRTNMMKRMKQIISIVNHEITEYKLIDNEFNNKIVFELSQENVNRMFKDVHNNIVSWKGVDLNSCEKQKSSFKEYNKTCLNWFNRNKAKIYGNHFFYPLIFIHILNFCIKNNNINLTDPSKKAHLFITILLKILRSKIKFVRTKQQPLLPNQSLMQPNKFKTTFIKFIENFNLKCNAENISSLQTVQIYHKDKKRSLKILALFVKSLEQIESMLLSPHHNQTNSLQSQTEPKSESSHDDIDIDIVMNMNRIKLPLISSLTSTQRPQQQLQTLQSLQSLFPSHAHNAHNNYNNNNNMDHISTSTQSSVSPCTPIHDQNPSLILPQSLTIPMKSPFVTHGHIKQPSAYHNHLNNNNNNVNITNIPVLGFQPISTDINTNQNSYSTATIGNNNSKKTKIHKINPYSIYVPLQRNYTLKYQFLSFNPLKVKKIMIISNRPSV